MISYLNKYTPRLAELGDSLKESTKKRYQFLGPEHTQAFDAIKKEIISVPILRYCDLNKPLTL